MYKYEALIASINHYIFWTMDFASWVVLYENYILDNFSSFFCVKKSTDNFEDYLNLYCSN